MPLYSYTAVDNDGRKLKSSLEASSLAALDSALKRQGQWLATAEELRQISAAGSGTTSGNVRVSRRILIEFFLSLGLQLRSGVPLFTALNFALEEEFAGGFKDVHTELLSRVKAGASLSSAMQAQPKAFPSLVVNLVRAGEASGRLGEACHEIQRHYEWIDRMSAETRQALFYPIFVLSAAIVFFFIVFSFLIPRFTGVLNELGVPLPALTRILIGVSDFMKTHYLSVGGMLLGCILSLIFGPRYSKGFARGLDALKLRLPVFGPLLQLICLARLIQNLATLYRSGIPVLEAMDLCVPLVGNLVVEDSLLKLRDGVNEGKPLNETMRQLPVFSKLMVQMVAVGETTGTLDQSLQHVADYYNELVPRKVKRVFAVLEPMMIIGLIFLVGLVVLAIFLPIAAVLATR